MSTTMIVCLIIIGICTLVIIASKVYELIQTAKLEEANKLLIGLKGNDSDYRIDREGLLGGEMLIYRGR